MCGLISRTGQEQICGHTSHMAWLVVRLGALIQTQLGHLEAVAPGEPQRPRL